MGGKLVDSIIGIAKDKGLERVWTSLPLESDSTRGLCKRLEFDIEEGEETFIATLPL